MDFSFTPEEERFRAEVRAFIRDHLPKGAGGGDGDLESSAASLPALYTWNQALLAKRWVGFNWPKEVGGGGGSLVEQMILKEEMARHKAPPLGLSYMGLAWVGPALIKYGTPEQQAEHIPPILKGDTPGITVKPIKEMNGGAMFAEVFLEEVRVPVANRLGAEGQGWEVTKDALANERSSIGDVWALKHRLEGLKDLARRCRRRGRRALDDPGIRQRLARMETQVEAMRLNGLRFLTKQLRGEPLGAETSINKLIRAKVEIESGRLARDIEGTYGVLTRKSPHAIDGGKWQRVMLGWPPYVIGGGTPNIQKNVIAERMLGLPHDT